jgi:hypothetical protein
LWAKRDERDKLIQALEHWQGGIEDVDPDEWE